MNKWSGAPIVVLDAGEGEQGLAGAGAELVAGQWGEHMSNQLLSLSLGGKGAAQLQITFLIIVRLGGWNQFRFLPQLSSTTTVHETFTQK